MTGIALHLHGGGHYDISLRLDDGMAGRFDNIQAMLTQLTHKVDDMAVSVADIKAAVQDERTVEDSLLALVKTIQDELTANGPAAVQQVLDMIADNKSAMSAALTANTPADTGGGTIDTGV